MEMSELLEALRRSWLVILVATAVAAIAAGAVTAAQSPVYTATAQGIVSVSSPEDRPPYALASGAQYILDRMTSYAALGNTTPVLAPVVDELNLGVTPLVLSDSVDSHTVVGKAVIEVSVVANDPKGAAAVADGVIAQIARSISALESGNIEMTPTGAATVPIEPSNGKVLLTAGVAGAGGLVMGCLMAVGFQLRDRRRMHKEIQRVRGYAASSQ